MSGNSIKFALIALLTAVNTLHAAKSVDKKDGFFEDPFIVEALFAEENRDSATASEIFLFLYKKTGKYEYLQRSLNDAVDEGKVHSDLISEAQEYLKKTESREERENIAVWLAKLYVERGDIKKSNEIINKYLSNTKDKNTLKQLYVIYLYQKRYEDAYRVLKKRYSLYPDSQVIVNEAEILYQKLDKKQEAEKLLESYIHMHKDASPSVYMSLINIYIDKKDIDGIIRTYESLYSSYPKKYILQKIVKLYLYRKDIEGLISFLRRHEKGNEELLYMLYREKRDIKNTLDIADKLYISTKNPKWLAEKSMLMYEEAKKDKKITPLFLKKFSEQFDKAIRDGADESVYLNYYGYTLIDHDIDIGKGLKLVREALKQKPDSYYYLDSMAWGLYKEGKCTEANRVMEKVSRLGGLREEEIKEHKTKIDQCIKNGKDK